MPAARWSRPTALVAVALLSGRSSGTGTCRSGARLAVEGDAIEDGVAASVALLQRDGLASRGARSQRQASQSRSSIADDSRVATGGPFDKRKHCHVVEAGPDWSTSQCYPDLMLLGNSKCASTSIAAYLLNHPQVILHTWDGGEVTVPAEVAAGGTKSLMWETNIFDDHVRNKENAEAMTWRSAPRLSTADVGNHLELSYRANYFAHPDVPFRIVETYPNAKSIKYIVILREPVARTISSWKFHELDGRSFRKAADDGIAQHRALRRCYNESLADVASSSPIPRYMEDLPPEAQRKILDKCFWGRPDTHDTTWPDGSYLQLMYGHVEKSVYVDHLRRWHAVVGKDNVFVFSLEEFAKDPSGMYTRLADFAGFEAVGKSGFKDDAELREVLAREYNEGDEHSPYESFRWLAPKRGPESMPTEEDKTVLADFFRSHDEALFELVGRRMW